MPTEHRIEVPASDGTLPLYEVVPEGTSYTAVVVLQEAFGVNDHVEDVTRRFAATGRRAVAPHLYHRTGDVRLGYGDDDRPTAFEHLGALTGAGLEADLDATLDHLRAAGVPDERIAVVGFCMGGSVALMAGRRTALGAAVSFYGGGIAEGRFGQAPLVEQAAELRSSWLGIYGDQDTGIPPSEVEQLRAAANGAAVPTEVVRYPDAGHGFHCDVRASYEPDSAADAWSRTLAFLDEHLPR